MARQGRVTSVDVAREAGVSQTTVSYVLNDVTHQKISEETRRRVFEAVEKLGYTPSAAARTLRRGRSDIVLLLLADVPLGFTAMELVEHLTSDLEAHGLSVITRIENGRTVNSLWRDLAPAAVVLFAPVADEQRARMRAGGTHVVNVWRDGSGEEDSLTPSQTRIGRLQVGHLVAAGHRQLGYAAPADTRLQDFYELRLQGASESCVEQGLGVPVVREVPFDTASAADVVKEWRAAGVTGVCAYNDEVAFALLAGMRTAGLSAPADLAVIGVDDIALAQFADPPLTTVSQHMDVIANDLADAVLKGMPNPRSSPGTRAETATLVIRSSA
ncbi:LacI family DNA-binding transcriptional regulator [Streptomyces sp. NPDC102462]|uniref:LacI family DNA-binding transcriptional regulator n=1 Tax=Streptomyces sp. NPDC102462 TaxID=3366178 RepID=UPI00382242EA